MSVLQIAVLAGIALAISRLPRGRQFAILVVSALVIFWLQPAQSLVGLEYWLPFATLSITVMTWVLTSTKEVRGWRDNWLGVVILLAIFILVDLNSHFKFTWAFTDTTPRIRLVLVAVIGMMGMIAALLVLKKIYRFLLVALFVGILLIFILLKSPDIFALTVSSLSKLINQNIDTASTGISWLGYSYLAFRLLHTIRDRQTGRLPATTLVEYINYVIFFPSFTAGPIDRIERFIKELRVPLPLANEDLVEAGTRLFVGLFKKFVLADTLAIISISDILVSQVKFAGWLWIFLYAYAFRIYFDFSGYTDIAIGLGRLLGIRLPENFASPYLKPSLDQFWSSWHITLTQWFRSYFFYPWTRWLRTRKFNFPTWLIIFTAQVCTMVLIGLWHGVTAGFIVWGLWHGVGLFIQNRWSQFVAPRIPGWGRTNIGQKILNGSGVFLTFNFVALGWLFFNLSTPAIAWLAILRLAGLK